MVDTSFRAFMLLAGFALLGTIGCHSQDKTISRCIPEGACAELETSSASTKTALSPAATKGDASKGAPLYQQLCAECHGPSGEGVAGVLSARFDSGVWQKTTSDDRIRLVLQNGKGQMPAFPQLKGNDIRNVIQFVRTLKKAPASMKGSGY